jgi:hypothetical protein
MVADDETACPPADMAHQYAAPYRIPVRQANCSLGGQAGYIASRQSIRQAV